MKKAIVKIFLFTLAFALSWYCGALSNSNHICEPQIIEIVVEKEVPCQAAEEPIEETDEKVYITETGKRYHAYDCPYLKSCIETNLSYAERYYTPCQKCLP